MTSEVTSEETPAEAGCILGCCQSPRKFQTPTPDSDDLTVSLSRYARPAATAPQHNNSVTHWRAKWVGGAVVVAGNYAVATELRNEISNCVQFI